MTVEKQIQQRRSLLWFGTAAFVTGALVFALGMALSAAGVREGILMLPLFGAFLLLLAGVILWVVGAIQRGLGR